jgi:hypothetical protein
MSFLRHGESIAPMTFIPTGSKQAGSLPVLIGRDEFQPAIPWQVALQQSLPPLRRPRTILQNETSPYNDLSANGDIPLNSVSHLKGALQRADVRVDGGGRGGRADERRGASL